MKYRTSDNYKPLKKEQETIKGKSMTIKGQVKSITEMLQMYSQGIPVRGGHEGYFDDDSSHASPDLDELKRLDATELQELKEDIETRLAEVKELAAQQKEITDESDEGKSEASKAETQPVESPQSEAAESTEDADTSK